MKLGFYTSYSEEILDFAQKTGFRCLELAVWPDSNLDARKVTDEQIEKIKDSFFKHDLEISALSVYPNYLDPDPVVRQDAQSYFFKVLELAKRMGVGVVCTFAGGNPYCPMDQNINDFTELFTRFCEKAEENNVKVALENCPMLDKNLSRPNNIAFSPFIWDVMFEKVPSKSLGIELDPSHMVWMGIDYIKAIYDYRDRIFHVHAKDMEVRSDVLRRSGILGGYVGQIGKEEDVRWWRGRIPGMGSVDWPRFISTLIEVEYNGNICIEHEDSVIARGPAFRNFKQHSELVEAFGHDTLGLTIGYHTLSGLIPQEN